MPWSNFKHPQPQPEQALPGRVAPLRAPERHYVNGQPLQPPFPAGMEQAIFGLGCFWGCLLYTSDAADE